MNVFQLGMGAIGAFYAFAGHVATRAALTGYFVDRAIAAIDGQPVSRAERIRSWWLLIAATVVLAGGMALLFLLDIAAWLFLASSLGQAIYLFWLAPRYMDIDDPPDPQGRRRSVNAFIIYVFATVLVFWARAAGLLQAVDQNGLALPILAAAVVAAHIGYVVWNIVRAPPYTPPLIVPGEEGEDPALSKRIHVFADFFAHPLWALDEDKSGDFPPEDLGLSAELVRDLRAWADEFDKSYQPDGSDWSEADRATHGAKAAELAARIAREKPDRRIYISGTDGDELIEIGPAD